LGFAVFLAGAETNARVEILRRFNIPEPVTGGLAMALLVLGLYLATGIERAFELNTRDFLLVLFFAGIGLNARLSDLLAGGKPLLILSALTVLTILAQNVIGAAGASLFGYPLKAGVLFGSAALIGGPIAKHLVEKYALTPDRPDEVATVGLPRDPDKDDTTIDHMTIMRVLFYLNLAIILGYFLHAALDGMGLKLPLFVPCLVMGIVIANLRAVLVPNARPVTRTPSLALVSEFALGAFLAMSLMSLQLWTIADLGFAIVVILAAQTLFTLVFVLYVLFPLMGRGYRAAVLSAGFGGFALGATPTAIANMTAVTKRYGPSPIAFIVLPLVSAFIVDIANAIVIQTIVTF
jgi:ESS family glutamate:Na+ symporter